MVLVWTGRGIVIPLVFLVMAVAAIMLTVTEFTVPLALTSNQATNLTVAVACLLSALVTWPIGRLVMKHPRVRTISDAKTGGTMRVMVPDTFLWVDVRYWTYILVVIGIALLFVAFVVR